MNLRKIKSRYLTLPYYILRLSIRDTINQDGVEHAGYLAFLSILSLFPFLIFLFTISTYFGNSENFTEFVQISLSHLPEGIAQSLSPRIDEIVYGPPQGLLTIAIIGIIWTASSAVEGLRTILNRAFRVPSPPSYLLGRSLSILQFIIITITILTTITTFVILPAILRKLENIVGIDLSPYYDWFYFRQLLIILILFMTSSMLYQHITDVSLKFSQTVPGACMAIALWVLILKLFGIYLTKFNQFSLVYGSLAGIIGAMMFFYLVSLAFIIGAQFNYHFDRVYGKKLRREN